MYHTVELSNGTKVSIHEDDGQLWIGMSGDAVPPEDRPIIKISPTGVWVLPFSLSELRLPREFAQAP